MTDVKLESESSEDQILMFDLEVNNVNEIAVNKDDTSSIISNKQEQLLLVLKKLK